MAYRTVAHGTILLPEDYQDLFDFVFDPSTQQYRKLSDDFLSDGSNDIKARFQTYRDELRVTQTSGLTVSYQAGHVRYTDGTITQISQGSLNVQDNSTNYVYVNEVGEVTSSTSIPDRLLILAQVITSGGIVTAINDMRARWSIPQSFGGDGEGGEQFSILDLNDTPSSYEGRAGQVLAVNSSETGFTFVPLPSASGGGYAVTDTIQVVDGSLITLSAGITQISSDGPLLPVVTSASQPDASRVSVSSIWSSSYPGWKALNQQVGGWDAWISGMGVNPAVTPQWWQYDFPEPVTIGRMLYSKRGWYGNHGQLKDFKIQKMSGGTPTDLLTITDTPSKTAGELHTFPLSVAESGVSSIRVFITGIYKKSQYPWCADIARIQFHQQTTASSSVGAVTGGFAKARQAILSGLAISGNKAFVSTGISDGTDRVAVVDVTTHSTIGDFSLGDKSIYEILTVTDSSGGSFSYSVQQNIQEAPLAPYGTTKLYVGLGNEVLVFDQQSGTLMKTIDCGIATEISGIAVSTRRNKVFVTAKGGAIVVIDAGNDTVAVTLTGDDDAVYGGVNHSIAIDDDRDSVYVTSSSQNRVLVLNTVTNTLVTSISVGSRPEGIGLSSSQGLAAVCNRAANTVSIISTLNNTVGASIAMSEMGSGASPVAVAIDDSTTPARAVVALYDYHQIAIIDLSTNQIVGRAATPANPVDCRFVPSTGEIYVASEGGEITVISQSDNT
jgi:YVTN family beta-propeller protein